MKTAPGIVLVLITTPSLKAARALARIALNSRTAACANIVPRMESHYWWRGRQCSSKECLMLLKTRRKCLRKLEHLVLQHHPYDTPEFIVLAVSGGNAKYLAWLAGEVIRKGK